MAPLIVIDEVPLPDAIRNLARQAQVKFMFDPGVIDVANEGRPNGSFSISIRFENVTSREAPEAVLRTTVWPSSRWRDRRLCA